jgi:hypothetical protein
MGNTRLCTLKQREFAYQYVELANATRAYRKAYKVAGWSDEAVAVEAQKLLKNPKVQKEVQDLTEIRKKAVGMSAEMIIGKTVQVLEESHDPTTKLKALEMLAKWKGMGQNNAGNQTNVQINYNQLSEKEIDKQLQRMGMIVQQLPVQTIKEVGNSDNLDNSDEDGEEG